MTVAAIWTGGKMYLPDDRSSNAEIANVLTMAALSGAVYPVDPMDVAIRRARQPLSPPFWGT